MLRRQLFTAGAGVLAALGLGAAAGTGAAFAQQFASDADVWDVRGHVVSLVYQLEGLQPDYAGNRPKAITALKAAGASLNAALAIRGGANQSMSDVVIKTCAAEVSALIPRLQADRNNYGANKDQAIAALQSALGFLTAASGLAQHP